jgi:hypothetical protein
MLMLARKIKYLLYLRVRHIIWINSARAAPLMMNLKHDPASSLAILIEHALQNVNYELHGRVVIVEEQHLRR